MSLKMDQIGDLRFDLALPLMSALWRRGVLTPFIGSGMSRPSLESWDGFLANLGTEVAEDAMETTRGQNAVGKQRLADRISIRTKALSTTKRAEVIRRALLCSSSSSPVEIPPQTKALAELYWPLVVSTNYDDLYVAAAGSGRSVKVCGRGRQDCHNVLRALDENSPALLWTVQGFLGGQAFQTANLSLSPEKLRELIAQLVIGHQQYVQATNAEPHFRRAFAEVFRRRSLLFLGSQMQEDYFVNLFAEIVHHHGLGAFPHFALLDQKAEVDSWFLQTRLGISVIRYHHHAQLPELLTRLAKATTWKNCLPGSTETSSIPLLAGPTEFGYRILSHSANSPLSVRCVFERLPVPREKEAGAYTEASVVSVGRWENTPLEGDLVITHLAAAEDEGAINSADRKSDWQALDTPPSYVFRLGSDTPIFAVAARRKDFPARRHDRRDLRIIPEAVCAALQKIDDRGYHRVLLSPVASGKQSSLHPVHTFAQTLRGIRRFAALGRKSVLNVDLHVVDPRVWALLASGKIPVTELLSAELLPFRVEVWDSDGNVESFRLLHTESPSVNNLLLQARLRRDDWRVFLVPSPTDKTRSEEVAAGDDETLSVTMTLVLRPLITDPSKEDQSSTR